MRFHKVDFLSSSPQGFIFQNSSNKTNFGGVLSVIYLIILIIIIASYLVFFLIEDNYKIEYLYYEKILTPKERTEKRSNPKYNPKIDFDIHLYQGNKEDTEDRFIIKDFYQKGYPTINKIGKYNKHITEVDWIILYDCLNNNSSNCSIDETKTFFEYLTLEINFKGYIFDHQNKKSPFHILEDGYLTYTPSFSLSNPVARGNIWSVVKYKEEKGFFAIFDIFRDKNEDDDKYIGTVVKSFEEEDLSKDFNTKNIFYRDQINNNTYHYYKVIGELYFFIDYNHFEEYKRTPKSFWDTIANICSLGMTVFSGFTYVFINYYSNNFDNYKIMEKIISNSNKKIEKRQKELKQIELSNDFKNEEKTDNLIDNSDEDNNNIILIDNNDNNNIDNEDKNELLKNNKDNNTSDSDDFPKLRFIDFLLNNLYSDKFCKQNRQKIIHICNEIISKYYSIECILYNQIKFENLLKDYKWNDPQLNKFDNNELIIKLNNIIYSIKNT